MLPQTTCPSLVQGDDLLASLAAHVQPWRTGAHHDKSDPNQSEGGQENRLFGLSVGTLATAEWRETGYRELLRASKGGCAARFAVSSGSPDELTRRQKFPA